MIQLLKVLLNFCKENMSNEENNQVLEGIYDAHIQQGGDITDQLELNEAKAETVAERETGMSSTIPMLMT